MRLLLVGGFADSLLNFRGPLIDDLLKAGVEVHVAAPGIEEGEEVYVALRARGAIPHSVALQRTGLNPLADLMAIYGLWRLMRQLRPDAFLGYTIKPVVYGVLAAWFAGVRGRYALITGLGYAFQDRPQTWKAHLVSGVARGLYRFSLKRATKVLFQNPDDEGLFRSSRILDQRVPSVVVNGSGVDIQAFKYVEPPEGKFVFLMIARLLVAKGVREYVGSAKRLRADFPNVRFLLAGWLDGGPDSVGAAELAAWVDEGMIEYLGRLDDVRPALNSCNVYVLPSYREGTPRTVLEAMSVGRAVITTDAPGCRETVVDGCNGYLVPVRSVEGLSEAMNRLLISPGEARRMGKESRRIAAEKYDVRQVNAVMLDELGVKP